MRPLPQLLVLVPAAVVGPQVHAATYLTVPQAQAALFPSASQFVDSRVHLTDPQRDAIKKLSGVRQREPDQPVWQVMQGGAQVGWFMVDEVVGKHEFITYAVGTTLDGHVAGIEILDYRETYGYEVREPSWRQNFQGKALADALAIDRDIPNITGATLSCRNVTNGVKRLLALQQVALSHAR